MDEVVSVRNAARDAVDDIEPADLRALLDDLLADASMVPASLAVLCACSTESTASNVSVDGELADRAVGVQLIYEGLRLTRRLVHDEPWADAPDDTDHVPADVEILAADVLVARGFGLLANTEAAGRAVEVVRAFGRDQTGRDEAPDPVARDRELEADVFALAATAGLTATGGSPDAALLDYTADLGRRLGPDLPATLTAGDRDRVSAAVRGERDPAEFERDGPGTAGAAGDS